MMTTGRRSKTIVCCRLFFAKFGLLQIGGFLFPVQLPMYSRPKIKRFPQRSMIKSLISFGFFYFAVLTE
ncbi:uncharacterized protein ASCRUDRAFT_76629 [Ascoidea rubescens DSM 1968]|uniref:Uncharacterized protein n=1 Tax=Ascoidea rubescens DSM 1968 TaxID=1344418 RepID=A0A1D2VEJ1_9ASCO|nr:hypothetical protein ASCRUDRAFT_76629 [Ascoidea rubescens DSM 1968]ODV60118.1 hypothetical protein ASCRUDRAFT_76629 [Ascoidea rubescens DSM 1968]